MYSAKETCKLTKYIPAGHDPQTRSCVSTDPTLQYCHDRLSTQTKSQGYPTLRVKSLFQKNRHQREIMPYDDEAILLA